MKDGLVKRTHNGKFNKLLSLIIFMNMICFLDFFSEFVIPFT